MKTSYFTTLRFVLALITVLAIIGHPHLPPKKRQLFPDAGTESDIYGPPVTDGVAPVSWVNKSDRQWRCDYRRQFGPVNCGLTMRWKQAATGGSSTTLDGSGCEPMGPVENGDGSAHSPVERVNAEAADNPDCTRESDTHFTQNFSEYEGLRVKIDYEGRANFLRLNLRNNHPDNSGDKNLAGGKLMSALVRTDDLRSGHIYVDLKEFVVEEWWIKDVNASRQQALPDFGHVASVGVELIEHGVHRVRVENIELVGQRLTTAGLLALILVVWSGALILEGVVRYRLLYRYAGQRATEFKHLVSHVSHPGTGNRILKTRDVTDALTGAFNRAGVEQQLQAWQAEYGVRPVYGLLLFDIDCFKRINDLHGHDVGDQILKDLAQCVGSQIRPDDIFARWSGEEFVLLTRQNNKAGLMGMAEKLRSLIEERQFESALQLNVTVSIGAASVQKGDSFNIVLKRADVALYKAKMQGNCVAYAD